VFRFDLERCGIPVGSSALTSGWLQSGGEGRRKGVAPRGQLTKWVVTQTFSRALVALFS
jgi:hypothetical protein